MVLARALIPLLVAVPYGAYAQEASRSVTETTVLLLYGMIGFFGALAVVTFIGGLIVYAVRFGTERRALGIDIMVWGVAIMVAVIFAIGVLRFVQG